MAEADAATRTYLTHPRSDRPLRHRPQHLAQAHAARADRRSGHLRRQPAAHPRRGAARTRASCASTWRTPPYTDVTLDIFETIWQQGYRNAGVVLQSYLPRSVEDARRMNRLGARVRLVKGAYKEPRGVAHQSKADVDAAFVEIMKLLLAEGTYPAIATHDPAMIRRDAGSSPPNAAWPRTATSFRCCTACVATCSRAHGCRPDRSRLHPIRPGMVSILHAPSRRAPCQSWLRRSQHPAGATGRQAVIRVRTPRSARTSHVDT